MTAHCHKPLGSIDREWQSLTNRVVVALEQPQNSPCLARFLRGNQLRPDAKDSANALTPLRVDTRCPIVSLCLLSISLLVITHDSRQRCRESSGSLRPAAALPWLADVGQPPLSGCDLLGPVLDDLALVADADSSRRHIDGHSRSAFNESLDCCRCHVGRATDPRKQLETNPAATPFRGTNTTSRGSRHAAGTLPDPLASRWQRHRVAGNVPCPTGSCARPPVLRPGSLGQIPPQPVNVPLGVAAPAAVLLGLADAAVASAVSNIRAARRASPHDSTPRSRHADADRDNQRRMGSLLGAGDVSPSDGSPRGMPRPAVTRGTRGACGRFGDASNARTNAAAASARRGPRPRQRRISSLPAAVADDEGVVIATASRCR